MNKGDKRCKNVIEDGTVVGCGDKPFLFEQDKSADHHQFLGGLLLEKQPFQFLKFLSFLLSILMSQDQEDMRWADLDQSQDHLSVHSPN
ncbi:MAG: hypothetical protein ACOYXO_12740 [Chloroflexota bacterium]